MSYAKSIICGNMGKPLECRATAGGKIVFSGSVATNHKWKDKGGQIQEKTTWHRIVIWNDKLGQFIADHTKAGSKLLIEGRPEINEWEDKNGVKQYTHHIVADTIQIVSGWVESSEQSGEHNPPNRLNENGTQKSPYADNGPPDYADDDIPF
jgi:single-strand DNA-binding protein